MLQKYINMEDIMEDIKYIRLLHLDFCYYNIKYLSKNI